MWVNPRLKGAYNVLKKQQNNISNGKRIHFFRIRITAQSVTKRKDLWARPYMCSRGSLKDNSNGCSLNTLMITGDLVTFALCGCRLTATFNSSPKFRFTLEIRRFTVRTVSNAIRCNDVDQQNSAALPACRDTSRTVDHAPTVPWVVVYRTQRLSIPPQCIDGRFPVTGTGLHQSQRTSLFVISAWPTWTLSKVVTKLAAQKSASIRQHSMENARNMLCLAVKKRSSL